MARTCRSEQKASPSAGLNSALATAVSDDKSAGFASGAAHLSTYYFDIHTLIGFGAGKDQHRHANPNPHSNEYCDRNQYPHQHQYTYQYANQHTDPHPNRNHAQQHD